GCRNQSGFKIEIMKKFQSVEDQKAERKEMKQTKEEIKTNEITKLLSPEIVQMSNTPEIVKLNSSEDKNVDMTEDQRYALKLFRLKKFYDVADENITKEFIENYDTPSVISSYSNLRQLFSQEVPLFDNIKSKKKELAKEALNITKSVEDKRLESEQLIKQDIAMNILNIIHDHNKKDHVEETIIRREKLMSLMPDI